MVVNKKISDVYNEFHPKILPYVRRMVGVQDAEDVTQVVFEKVHRGLHQFKGESSLATWIYRIATNSSLDRLKSATHQRSVAGPLAPFPLESAEATPGVTTGLSQKLQPPDQKIIRDEMLACIREFVDRLPPDYRTIIILNELEGFTNRELAEILQISLAAAKIRLHRARAQLKKYLEQGCDFYHDEQSELACDRKQPNGL
jgi:RNA polymerase sigma-70 factor (ECF subfamily)